MNNVNKVIFPSLSKSGSLLILLESQPNPALVGKPLPSKTPKLKQRRKLSGARRSATLGRVSLGPKVATAAVARTEAGTPAEPAYRAKLHPEPCLPSPTAGELQSRGPDPPHPQG